MFYVLISAHILICLTMVLLVLVQQGKGADAGAVTSSSENLFGPMSSGNSASKATTWLAIAFMITSILLVKAFNSQSFRPSVNAAQNDAAALADSKFAEPIANSEEQKK